MSSTAITTVVKMLESLPETVQDQVMEHLRESTRGLQQGTRVPKALGDFAIGTALFHST